MKNRLQISKTIGGSAMKRNVSTPGFSRLPTSIELTRLDSTTNIQDKGGFQLEFVSISWVINHMTCYNFKCSCCWKIYLKKNPLQDLLSSLNAVISTNERH